jgi:hypothetical protein
VAELLLAFRHEVEHDPRRGPRQPTLATSAMQMPRGRVYPATMHGGV